MTEGAELYLSVDNPLAAPDFNDPAPDAVLFRLPRYPYFVATGTLNPTRAARLLAAMQSGNTVTVTEAGDGITLPLRRSAREIARVRDICGPPASGPEWSALDPVAEAPGMPQNELTPTAPETPAPSGEPAPQIAADWLAMPEDPVEETAGTSLCFGDALDPTPVRCLQLRCFGAGTDAMVWWQDESQGASGGAAPITVTGPGGSATGELTFVPAPDAPHRIGTGPLDRSLFAAVSNDGAMTVSVAGAEWRLTARGAAGAFQTLGETCALPVAQENAEEPSAETDVPSGLVRVTLPETALSELGPETLTAFMAVHGQTLSAYQQAMGEPAQVPGAALFDLGPGQQLLFTRLCGRGGYFGARGCVVEVFANPGNGWQDVFFSSGDSDTYDLDFDRAVGGWPEIVINNGAARWAWSGTGYRIR